MTTGSHARLFVAVVFLAGALCGCHNPEASSRAHLARGDQYFAAKKYDEASIEYRSAIQQMPRLAEAHYKLAETLAAKSDVVGALGAYVRAADLDPKNADAQIKAANLLLLARRYEDARTRLRAVLTLEPSNTRALIMLGNALAGLGNLDEAVAANQRAVALAPDRDGMYINLGALQYIRGDKIEAEAAYLAAVKVAPTSVPAHLALADYYFIVGRQADAERVYMETVQLNPADPETNKAVGNFFIRTGKLMAAGPYLQKRAEVLRTPESWYDLADYYLATKRRPLALEILTRMAGKPETYATATVKLAFLAAVAHERALAMRLLDEVLDKDHTNAAALALKTHVLLANRQRTEALATAEQAVRADSKLEAAHFAHAAAASALGQLAVAEAALLEVLKLDPASTEANIELARICLREDRADTALQYAEQAVKQNPNLVEARLVRLRAIAQHSLQGDRAATELGELLKKYPKSPEVLYEAGLVALTRQDNASAYNYFTKARELDPSDLQPLIELIKLDVDTRNLPQARRRVDELIAKDPSSTDALLLAGTTYAMIDGTVAERYLRKVIEQDSSSITAYEALAALYLTQGRLEQARQEFTTLSQKQPNSVAPATMVGILYDVGGNKPSAEQWYRAALKIDPHAPTAANNLAWNYVERGEQLENALDLAQIAHRELPNQAEVTDTLGWVYLKKGLIDQAVRTLEVAVQQDSKQALYQYHLGLAYAQHGEDGRAKQSLQQVLILDPKFAQAADVHRALAKLLY
jgi:tetratricopeptide (TPR) repeat protein